MNILKKAIGGQVVDRVARGENFHSLDEFTIRQRGECSGVVERSNPVAFGSISQPFAWRCDKARRSAAQEWRLFQNKYDWQWQG